MSVRINKDQLKIARYCAEMTTEELSERTGINKQTIQKIERGCCLPQVGTLKKICDALHVDMRDVLEPCSKVS